MSKPMTTIKSMIEANILGRSHMENGTCSVTCTNCQNRVWFTGNMEDQSQEYVCPYCQSTEFNKNLGDQHE